MPVIARGVPSEVTDPWLKKGLLDLLRSMRQLLNARLGHLRTVSADHEVEADDETLLVDASGGNVMVRLRPAATWGRPLTVKKIDGGTHAVLVVYPEGEIDGVALVTLVGREYAVVVSDGTQYWRIGG
jgi:hypothetical protein